MDPNQQGQPTQGGSVPPTLPTSPSGQATGAPAPGIPPEQGTGIPPEQGIGMTPAQGSSPAQDASIPPAQGVGSMSAAPTSPVFSAGQAEPTSTAAPQIIASGASPATGNPGGKKLSKGMIIGIVVIAILAVAAVVVGIVASNSSSNKSGNSSNSTSAPINMSELETAYNNLANYIAFGDENTSEIKNNSETYTQHDMLEMALSNGFYPYPILDADVKLDEASSGAKKAYFSGLEQLYSQLPDGLSEKYNIDASNIYDYYHEFSNIDMVSLSQIVEKYKIEGLESTRNYLENNIVTKSDKRDIKSYTDYLREYYIAFLNLVNDVKVNRGCEINPENINSCDTTSVASYRDYEEAQKIMETGAAYRIKATRQSASTKTLLEIYDLVNDDSGGNL